MPWMSKNRRIATFAVAAGLALTVGAGNAVADEVSTLSLEASAPVAVVSEGVAANASSSDVSVPSAFGQSSNASGSQAADSGNVTPVSGQASGSDSGEGSGSASDVDGGQSGSDADSGTNSESDKGTGVDSDATSHKDSGSASDKDSGSTSDKDSNSGSDTGAESGSDKGPDSGSGDSDFGDDSHDKPYNGWWTDPATGKLEYYVEGVLTAPDRVFYIDSNGDRYWYENGLMREEHTFYDPASDKWYWADAGGKCARNKDTYIPVNDEAEAGDWRNNGNGKWVRVGDDFAMVKGEDYRVSKDDGQWHWWFFDTATGQMNKNFVYVGSNGGKWVYYDDTYGWMVYGEQYRMTKDNPDAGYHWYYFDDHTGATTYGYKWITDSSDSYYGGKTVYYDSILGWMLYDWQVINGTWNYFDTATGRQCASTNAAHDACLWLNWAGGSAGATNDMYVMVDKGRLRTTVFRKVNGTWIPMQDYLCSVASGSGNHGNGTIEGFWHLGLLTNAERGVTNGSVYDHSSSGYGAQIDNFVNAGSTGITWSGPAIGKVAEDRFANTSYRYHYLEDQGIHSVVHTGGNEDAQLGQRNTDGCVRLSTVNARWIFDWVPMYTTIRIYSDVRY